MFTVKGPGVRRRGSGRAGRGGRPGGRVRGALRQPERRLEAAGRRAAGAGADRPAGRLPPGAGRAAALVAGWAARIEDARAAQRAYAAALHLAPGEGGAWGDVGAALAAEAQLRRAHPRFRPQAAAELRARAERLLRGGPAGVHAWMSQCGASPSHAMRRMQRTAPALAKRLCAGPVS